MNEQLLCPTPPLVAADAPAPVDVEFTGWMPAFGQFGNCGTHPQFNHVGTPPPGYRFCQSQEAVIPFLWLEPSEPIEPTLAQKCWRVLTAPVHWLRSAWRKSWLSLYIQAGNIREFGLVRYLVTVAAAFRLLFLSMRRGTRLRQALRFVHTRHLTSQLMLQPRPPLLFLTSVPYTFGQHPWVIEIEDATTLFFPFLENGKTAHVQPHESLYFPAIKALLEADNCRGILTHMRGTYDALPRMFQSDIIARKSAYVPMGVELPASPQRHGDDDTVELLFSNSWHQNPFSFYLRGGLEVLEAFAILHERYPQVRLTMRTSLPDLHPRHRRIMEKGWVRVIDRFLPDEDMTELMRATHLFLIPAARIHIVSVLRAMAYGHVVVSSDGWGFNEYVEHGRNGIIVPGRLGKTSWTDPDSLMLREDYSKMRKADPVVVEEMVQAVSTLVEDVGLRRRLGNQARRDVAERFSLANWNRGLAEFLDRARLVI